MKKYAFIFLCMYLPVCMQAQVSDTLRINLARAEEIFLKKNLLLLAGQYQVDAAKANIYQQQLYNNPAFSAELPAHGSNNKWFDIGGQGQKSFAIDQMISLAGKRNKRVALARSQSQGASYAFFDLLRTLKYELRQNYFTVLYSTELTKKYDDQMQLLQKIIAAYDEQAQKRNVPLKDAVRLKTEYIQLSADRNNVVMESIAAEQNLRLLLDTTVVIVPEEFIAPENRVLPPLDNLFETARQNRADLLLSENQVKQEQFNLQLQKALATPDLSVGAGYDQHGSYVNNLYTLRTSIELPFFNRNQGNIRSAKAQVKYAELVRDQKQTEVEKDVSTAVAKLQEAEREYRVSQQSFNKDFPTINTAVIENFNKGNISILEFLDFFENYNLAIRQLNQLEKQQRLAWEELEFVTGTSIK